LTHAFEKGVPVTLWLCATCGLEHPDTPEPPAGDCEICADERQYLPEGGQRWTTLAELQTNHKATVTEVEPDLFAITVRPGVGIGHRPLIVRTPQGNVLWDAPGYIDDVLVEAVRGIGGLAALASSHPHLTGLSVTWSETFDGIPIWYGEDDRQWIRRPSEAIQLWHTTQEVLPGVTLVQCGGHFAGSAVLHWAAGAEGRGVILTGDTLMVNPDPDTVSFMRSYPNRLPLGERPVRKIVDTIERYPWDRLYSGFAPGVIAEDAQEKVRRSAERHIGWIRDELRDPDERA
jgi:hypothetical protein